jgi:hypothetical protein
MQNIASDADQGGPIDGSSLDRPRCAHRYTRDRSTGSLFGASSKPLLG